MKRFVVASNIRGDKGRLHDAAYFARSNNAALVLIGDLIGKVLTNDQHADYREAVNRIGGETLEERMDRAANLKEKGDSSGLAAANVYHELISEGQGDTAIWGIGRDKAAFTATDIEDMIQKEGVEQYFILTDSIHSARAMQKVDMGGTRIFKRNGIFDYQTFPFGEGSDLKFVGGIGLSKDLGIKPESELPPELLCAPGPDTTVDVQKYVDSVQILFLNSLPKADSGVDLKHKVVILPDSEVSCMIGNHTAILRESQKSLSLYEIDGSTLVRTVYGTNDEPERYERINLNTLRLESEDFKEFSETEIKKTPNKPWYKTPFTICLAASATLVGGSLLLLQQYEKNSSEKPAPEKPAVTEQIPQVGVREESQEFYITFNTPENYSLARAVIAKYAQLNGLEKRPAALFHLASTMNKDGRYGVSEKELTDFIQANDWCQGVVPAEVTAETGMSYISPEYAFETEKSQEDLTKLIKFRAIREDKTYSKSWELSEKERLAKEYNAPEGTFLTNTIIAKY